MEIRVNGAVIRAKSVNNKFMPATTRRVGAGCTLRGLHKSRDDAGWNSLPRIDLTAITQYERHTVTCCIVIVIE